MKKWLKWGLLGVGGVVTLGLGGGGIFVWTRVSAFEESMNKVYDVPPLELKVQAAKPELLERGEHVARSIGGCGIKECHGSDMSGGTTIDMGPLASLTGPNITQGGLGKDYSDAEMARLIRHGIKKDGKSVVFMPMHEHGFMSDKDIASVIAYIRSLKPSDKPNGPLKVGTLGKILDRQDALVIDVARRIDHESPALAIAPEPTKEYGKSLGQLCIGCHGKTYGGGPLEGAPPDLPVPPNITSHETGLPDYSYEDFERLLEKGIKKDGTPLNKFMPLELLTNMNEVERRALYAYMRSVPPAPFGSR